MRRNNSSLLHHLLLVSLVVITLTIGSVVLGADTGTSFGWMADVSDSKNSLFKLSHHKVYKSSHVFLSYHRQLDVILPISPSLQNFMKKDDDIEIQMTSPGTQPSTVIARYNFQKMEFEWATAIDAGTNNLENGMKTLVFPLLNNCNRTITNYDESDQYLLGSIVVFANCTDAFPQFGVSNEVVHPNFSYTMVVRLNNTGHIVWHKMLTNGGDADADLLTQSIHVSECEPTSGDSTGAIYLAGPLAHKRQVFVNCTNVMQPLESSGVLLNSYVLKLSPVDGSCLWAMTAENASVTAMSSDIDYVYIAGPLRGVSKFYRGTVSSTGFTQNVTLGNFNDLYFLRMNKATGLAQNAVMVYGSHSYIPTGIVTPFDQNRAIISSNVIQSTTSKPQGSVMQLPKGVALIQWSRYGPSYLWTRGDGGLGGNALDLLSDGSLLFTTTCSGQTLTFNSRTYCRTGNSSFVNLRYSTSGTLIGVASVENNVSSVDMGVSVGVDGFALTAGYSADNKSIGSYDRELSSENSFDFVAQALSHVPSFCFGIKSYNFSACGGRGSCTGENTCSCKPGYYDSECQREGCNPFDPNVCNKRGICQLNNGYCKCLSGYGGENCGEFMGTVQVGFNKIGTYENLFPLTKTLIFSATIKSGFSIGDPPVKNVECSWQLLNEMNVLIHTHTTSDETIQSGAEVKQFIVPSHLLVAGQKYSTVFSFQVDHKHFSIVSTKVELVDRPTINDLSVTPNKGGAMLIDPFSLSSGGLSPPHLPITYQFGYLDQEGSTKFLNSRSSSTTLSTTLPMYGTMTLLVRGYNIFDDYTEKRASVNVDPLPASKATAVLTEQLDTMSQLSGEQLELQLSTYTTSLISSIDVIPSNQSSQITQLFDSLLDVMITKQEGLSTESQLSAVKTISGQYRLLSENSTIQTSTLLVNSLNRPDTIVDTSITAARNLANVMLSDNSSGSQVTTFTSVVTVLTTRVRENMTEGETTQISMPYLETVISRLDPLTSENTTISIRKPSSSDKVSRASNQEMIEVSLNSDALKQLGASYVQGQVASNVAEPYRDRCDSASVSSTVSTLLYTSDQQLIDRLDVGTTAIPISQAAMTLPVKQNMTDEYHYVCKYYDVDSRKWINNTNVCKTDIVNIDGEQVDVVCECMKPSLIQTVSLDYIQSASETQSSNREEVCTNPCGCGSKKKGLEVYQIVLISLAALTFVLFLAILVVSPFILYKVVSGVQKKKEQREAQGLKDTFNRELSTF